MMKRSTATAANRNYKTSNKKAFISNTIFMILLFLYPFYLFVLNNQIKAVMDNTGTIIGSVTGYGSNSNAIHDDAESDADMTVASTSESESESPAQPKKPQERPPQRPPECTPQQKSIIEQQLTPDKCQPKDEPWYHDCSFTKATKCPDTTWFDSYYQSIHANLKKNNNNGKNSNNNNGNISILPESETESESETVVLPSTNANFLAIFVGCNKGYDAINALRMGTGDAKYTKSLWEEQMGVTHENVCHQNLAMEFPIEIDDSDNGDKTGRVILDGTVHCIEPASITVDRLQSSASALGYDDKLIITKAGIASEVGIQYFPKITNVGVENKGLDKCARFDLQEIENKCEKVQIYTLDYYMEEVVPNNNKNKHDKDDDNNNKDKGGERVHLLSIDVEGFDYDVMLGAKNTLARTEYLEFEYNWMGSWKSQNLLDAVKMLDEYNFTCYWAGVGRAWRIDESCWLDHFSYHSWSNVACVNRLLNANVAQIMEETFIKTLEEEGLSY